MYLSIPQQGTIYTAVSLRKNFIIHFEQIESINNSLFYKTF